MKHFEFEDFAKSHRNELIELIERGFALRRISARLNKKYFPRSSKYISTVNLSQFIESESISFKIDYNACCKLTDKQLDKAITDLMNEERYTQKDLSVILHTPKTRITKRVKSLGFVFKQNPKSVKFPMDYKHTDKRLTQDEENKRKHYYNQGLEDEEIAQKCGVHVSAISYWRKSRNLESHYSKELTKKLNQRLNLYNQGKTDAELSTTLGISAETVFQWRKKNNLSKNKSKTPIIRKKRNHHLKVALYNQGFNDQEMADKLGLTNSTTRAWRIHNNLKSQEGVRLSKRLKVRMKLYNQGKTDKEISTTQNITPGHVALWRKQHNLSPNKKNKRKSV